MISWNPKNVPSDRVPESADQASTVAPEQAVHHPLGFADVRAPDAVAPPIAQTPRRPVGFAPVPEFEAPQFRTEISFRRQPRTLPVVHAEVVHYGMPVPEHPSVGHAAAWEDPHAPDPVTPVDTPEETPVTSASADSEKVPFYKREISFRRRRGAAEAPADQADENGASGEELEDSGESAPFGFTSPPADDAEEASASEAVSEPVAESSEPEEEETHEWLLPDPASPLEVEDEFDFGVEADEWVAPDSAASDELAVSDPFGSAAAGAEDTDEAAPSADDLDEQDPWGASEEASIEPVAEVKAEAAELDEPDTWHDETHASEYESPVDEAPVDEAPAEDAEHGQDAPVATNGRRSLGIKRGRSKPAAKRERARGSRSGRKVVGLKIGASQLAAAVVSDANGSHELLQLARTPLEAGVVVDGEVRDASALAHALKSFFEEHKLPRRDVRIGLASNRIGVRTFDIVGIDEPERFDNAVRFKAHEVLPVAVHESVLDYRVIEERVSEAGDPMRRVLLVVAPRDQVEPYVDVCHEAGLKLGGVDLEALGLLRAFVEPRPFASRTADDTATVVVAIGHEATTLLVSGGGACEFTRVFDWGGGALQSAIAQELDVPLVEATTILRHLSLAGTPKALASLDDESRARAVEAVRGRLTPFARELVSSLQFYQTQAESLGIGEIVITGGTAHLHGLGDALHQMIGVSVRLGDPLQRVVALTSIDAGLEATIGSMAVPIGLAIEDTAVRSVNLMPKELREQRKKPNIVAIAAPVAVAVPVAALALLFVQANGTKSDREAELANVRTAIAALPEPKRPIIDPGVATTEAQRAVALASVLGGRVSWDGVFRDLSLVLPANVSLTRVAAQLPAPSEVPAAAQPAATTATPQAAPSGVEIEGYTDDQPSVARLLSRLRTVPSLSNVQLESSSKELVAKQEIVRFKILADITQSGGAQ
jgi:type IV pilus assembly protein PilM